ncbi:gamma-glutamyl-gamma-aminobutyrate hydrolase family protein [Shewanella sp. 10N.286.45.A1]|uniref:gamma-glutamyl-gamma-aminobutyrate hydrolase family protein n=1 Tax=Shewanella sp. 10N.286.45.A1 TaxID=3229694 RepID=UPI00354F0ADA
MKRIGLTQRVDYIEGYDERRDALDQKWYSLLLTLDMLPIPLPNLKPELVPQLVENLRLDGVVFTGGNSLSHLDSNAVDISIERDEFELSLIDYAVKNELPIFGVCRGMQIISYYFGGKLLPIEGHIATKHSILSFDNKISLPSEVNSFHSWAIPDMGLGKGLQSIAIDSDGNIEAYIHPSKRIAGIMWHPERVYDFDDLDLNLMEKIFL